MDRIIINSSNFKYPRIKMEEFSFTKKEEVCLNSELSKLEAMFPKGFPSVFSVCKQDGLFSGSLKIKSSDIYCYGKSSTPVGLFYKLLEKLKLKASEKNILKK